MIDSEPQLFWKTVYLNKYIQYETYNVINMTTKDCTFQQNTVFWKF